MAETWDQDRIQKLIDDQIEESLTLEYKGKDSLGKSPGKKKEITKDVSAMANADGGTLIYGVAEYRDKKKKHRPEKIEPIDREKFSREWLEQVIRNVRPPIDDLIIHPVTLDTDPNDTAYVVDIPQSTTAHQATDFRYYKRHNFQAVPMEDYEIRDIMARTKHPKIEIEFNIMSTFGRFLGDSQLGVIARNAGPVYAKYIRCELLVPAIICSEPIPPEDIITRDGNEYVECSASNTIRDFMGLEGASEKYGPTWFNPLLPRNSAMLEIIAINKHSKTFDNQNDIVIHWTVFADNAPPNKGKTSLAKIPEEFQP